MTKTRDLADLGGGFIQAGLNAVQRSTESKLQDVVSVKDFGAVGDGVTDDTAAIQAAINSFPVVGTSLDITFRKGELYFPTGTYKITSQLNLAPGVSYTGPTINTRYFLNGITSEKFGATILLDNTAVEDAVVYESAQLQFSPTTISNLIFTQTAKTRLAASALSLRGGAKLAIKNCVFYNLGYETSLQLGVAGKLCNAIDVDNCTFVYNGDAQAQVVQPGTGYTYGDCIDGTYCADSKFSSNLIETNGGYGYKGLASNNTFDGNFIDLNKGGIYLIGGDRGKIVNTACKWNQDDGIRLDSVDRTLIGDCTFMGNNYKSSSTAATVGYGIALNSSTNIIISNCNLDDDYVATDKAAYKSVKQGNIKFGSGVTASVSHALLSAIDTGWDATLQTNQGFYDVASSLTTGNVKIIHSYLNGGPASPNSIHIPQLPVNPITGSTFITPVKRYVVRDVTGTVVGNIPIYDSVDSDLLSIARGNVGATLVPGAGSITLLPIVDSLRYCKVGPIVVVTGSIQVDTVSTPSGSLTLSGLPYAAVDSTDLSGVATCVFRVVGSTGIAAGTWVGRVLEGTTDIEINVQNGSAVNSTPANAIQANTVLSFSLTYLAS